MTIKQITKIPMFTSLIIVCSLIIPAIPILGIPITLQSFVVMLTGLFLMPLEAFIAMFLYLLIGVVGFPVFSGYTSGIGALLGPTGGFLLAFPLAASLISILRRSSCKTGYLLFITLLGGVGLVYLMGITLLSLHLKIGFFNGLKSMALFIVFDGIKVIVAVVIKQKMHVVDESIS